MTSKPTALILIFITYSNTRYLTFIKQFKLFFVKSGHLNKINISKKSIFSAQLIDTAYFAPKARFEEFPAQSGPL